MRDNRHHSADIPEPRGGGGNVSRAGVIAAALNVPTVQADDLADATAVMGLLQRKLRLDAGHAQVMPPDVAKIAGYTEYRATRPAEIGVQNVSVLLLNQHDQEGIGRKTIDDASSAILQLYTKPTGTVGGEAPLVGDQELLKPEIFAVIVDKAGAIVGFAFERIPQRPILDLALEGSMSLKEAFRTLYNYIDALAKRGISVTSDAVGAFGIQRGTMLGEPGQIAANVVCDLTHLSVSELPTARGPDDPVMPVPRLDALTMSGEEVLAPVEMAERLARQMGETITTKFLDDFKTRAARTLLAAFLMGQKIEGWNIHLKNIDEAQASVRIAPAELPPDAPIDTAIAGHNTADTSLTFHAVNWAGMDRATERAFARAILESFEPSDGQPKDRSLANFARQIEARIRDEHNIDPSPAEVVKVAVALTRAVTRNLEQLGGEVDSIKTAIDKNPDVGADQVRTLITKALRKGGSDPISASINLLPDVQGIIARYVYRP